MPLLGVVALAAVLRLVAAGDRLSDAEGYSWLVAAAPSADEFLARLAAYENTPPLFYALTALTPLDDEPWLRLWAIVPGVASVAVLWALVRERWGDRAALLAAALLAVAPYHVSYSNQSRGFMLANLGVLVALWAVAGERRRWWLYVAGAVVAVWAEYNAVAWLVGIAVVFAARREWRDAVLALAPAATLAAWVPEALRGLDAVDVTKIAPVYPAAGPASLRDLTLSLAFGEHGSASGGGAWLQFALVVAILGWAVSRTLPRSRPLLVVGGVTLLLHALGSLAGPDVFNQRYLSMLIPLAAAIVGAAVATLGPRWHVATAAAVALLAVAVVAQRADRELEPDYRAFAAEVRAAAPRDLRTNSAVLMFYLRDLEPRLDRPFGLSDGGDGAVVEDERVPGGLRAGTRILVRKGPLVGGIR